MFEQLGFDGRSLPGYPGVSPGRRSSGHRRSQPRRLKKRRCETLPAPRAVPACLPGEEGGPNCVGLECESLLRRCLRDLASYATHRHRIELNIQPQSWISPLRWAGWASAGSRGWVHRSAVRGAGPHAAAIQCSIDARWRPTRVREGLPGRVAGGLGGSTTEASPMPPQVKNHEATIRNNRPTQVSS